MFLNFRKILLTFFFFLLLFISFLLIGTPPRAEKISWGVTFSSKHAANLGLNWKRAYLALIDDLGAKNVKIAVHWDLIEPQENQYNFDGLDWQISEAEKREVNILLVIGMKTGRWPECHIPEWAKNLDRKAQQEKILNMISEIVSRYQNSPAIKYWQVENEPFFPFGECPWTDKGFVKEEIQKVKLLDSQKRPIVISDSGEGSLWVVAAQLGDIVGTTMYKKVWFSFSWEKRMFPFLPQKFGFYASYPFPPTFYWRKAQYVNKIFGKKVIVVELQAEPWGPKLLYDTPLQEQMKTMNLEQFKENVEFAKRTGLQEFYFWGAEWWYWMKEKQNQPQIWEEAKKLF
jgi:hypothetical protein